MQSRHPDVIYSETHCTRTLPYPQMVACSSQETMTLPPRLRIFRFFARPPSHDGPLRSASYQERSSSHCCKSFCRGQLLLSSWIAHDVPSSSHRESGVSFREESREAHPVTILTVACQRESMTVPTA